MEPSKATEEALGGSRTAFWRPKGDGVCGTCGGRRDAQDLSELNLDEVLPGFNTPCPRGRRIPVRFAKTAAPLDF